MQYILEFAHHKEFTEENFIISCCNLEAYRTTMQPQKWPQNRMLIIGPEGSGKSHLTKIFAKHTAAIVIDELQDNLDTSANAWVIENIERLGNEQWLFHTLNLAHEYSIKLMLTASSLPKYSLRDLQSRINCIAKVVIKRPDDQLLKALLMKHFSDMQLSVPQEVIEYIFTRTERSFAYVKNLVHRVDKLSLSKKREITVPLVREVLMQYMPENLDDDSEGKY